MGQQLEVEEKKIAFYATNPDKVAHLVPSQAWLGCGGILGAVESASGREATVLGKPSRLFLDVVMQQQEKNNINLEPGDMVMVGDRMDTDIKFGNQWGLKTVLVLSGVTSSLEEVEREKEKVLKGGENGGGDPLLIPDYVINCVGDMLDGK